MNQQDFERIAPWIHEHYRRLAHKNRWKIDFDVPFEQLPPVIQADNLAAARRMGDLLDLAGLRVAPRNGEPWKVEEQKAIRDRIERNIDLIAEGEHRGWMKARIANGWKLGLVKKVPEREHHLLVEWPQFRERIELKRESLQKAGEAPPMTLDEEVEQAKEYDRDAVRNYVDIIAETDYRIEPLQENAPSSPNQRK